MAQPHVFVGKLFQFLRQRGRLLTQFAFQFRHFFRVQILFLITGFRFGICPLAGLSFTGLCAGLVSLLALLPFARLCASLALLAVLSFALLRLGLSAFVRLVGPRFSGLTFFVLSRLGLSIGFLALVFVSGFTASFRSF